MKESTIRGFKTRVISELKTATKEKRHAVQSLKRYTKKTGRPLLLSELDLMVQSYIYSRSSRGTLITRALAKAAARAIIDQHPGVVEKNIDIESSSWAKSLFKRMGFVKRMKTSSKVNIPDGARREIEYLFHYEIVSQIEKYNIPHSMIINTLAEKGSKTVTVEGGKDKRTITGTFGIFFTNKF